MEHYRLARKKWPLVLVCAVFLSLELALYWGVTRVAIEALREGRALEGEWGWAGIVGWHLVIALAGVALGWQPLAELRTIFTDEGVRRPRLFGPPLVVRWAEAESVFVAPLFDKTYTVKINAPGKSVEINALFYKNADDLLALIERRMGAGLADASCPKLAAR